MQLASRRQLLASSWKLSAALLPLPPFVPARQRHHIFESHTLQALRGQGGAASPAAVADDWSILVSGNGVNLVLKLAARQRDRSGDGALRHLVGLADVNQFEVGAGLLHALQLVRVDFLDLFFGFV